MNLLKAIRLFSLPTTDITFGTRMMKSRLLYVLGLCFVAVLIFQAHTRVYMGGQKYLSGKCIEFTSNDQALVKSEDHHQSFEKSEFIFAENNRDDDEHNSHPGKKSDSFRFQSTFNNLLALTVAGISSINYQAGNIDRFHTHYKYIFQRTLRV